MEDNILELDDIVREFESVSIANHNSRSGLVYHRYQKFKVTQTDDELAKIVHLVDSHVPTLRERAAMRYDRNIAKGECNEESISHLRLLKDIVATKCPIGTDKGIEEVKRRIAELPKEWSIVQLTSQYNPLEHQNLDNKKYFTNGLHISVFDCGQNEDNPFLISVDPPTISGNKFELMQELMNTLEENNERLAQAGNRQFFKNKKEKYNYFLKIEDTEMTLRGIVKKMEENWLREWRCLLTGKYQDDTIEDLIKAELNKVFTGRLRGKNVSQRSKKLLYYITKGARYLQIGEIENAVRYCLSNVNDEDTILDVCDSIKKICKEISSKFKNFHRYPLILVVDECLDSVPWEMAEMLKLEVVTRVPSLHFVSLLFKAHESDIEKGYKIVKNYQNGQYIVNPDKDLARMETRMMSFFKYWLPSWKGINGRKPSNEEFFDFLKNSDIFSYSGHGSGTHLMTIEMLQKISVRAVVLLFGCASTRINRMGTQVDMYGSYHMYIISRCPCVLGMLWPVTDSQTDMLTTEFLSYWIPSAVAIPWANVDKTEWLKVNKCDTFSAVENPNEVINYLELPRALSYSKERTGHYITNAACVVRGLPVRIKTK